MESGRVYFRNFFRPRGPFSRMRSRRVFVIEGGLGVSMCSRDASLRSQASASVRKWNVRPCQWGKRFTRRLDVSLPCHRDLRSRVVALRCPAWQARHSVCADAVFVGPVVQSARFGRPEACQNWSKSFWRHSPVLVLDACRKRVKVGFRGRSGTLDDCEFVASLLCVVEFRGWHGTLGLFGQISWQAQYFRAWV